jgi:thiol:disulfide interchange protein DsbD
MKQFLLLISLLYSLFTTAQTADNPIVWESSINQISVTEYDVIFTAKLLQDWHLYSQENPEGASQPLEILIPEGKKG